MLCLKMALDQEFITFKEAKKLVKKLSIEETFVNEEEEEDSNTDFFGSPMSKGKRRTS